MGSGGRRRQGFPNTRDIGFQVVQLGVSIFAAFVCTAQPLGGEVGTADDSPGEPRFAAPRQNVTLRMEELMFSFLLSVNVDLDLRSFV